MTVKKFLAGLSYSDFQSQNPIRPGGRWPGRRGDTLQMGSGASKKKKRDEPEAKKPVWADSATHSLALDDDCFYSGLSTMGLAQLKPHLVGQLIYTAPDVGDTASKAGRDFPSGCHLWKTSRHALHTGAGLLNVRCSQAGRTMETTSQNKVFLLHPCARSITIGYAFAAICKA